jgi:transcriptional regulator with PAS, ATPase and Fis domain
MKVYSTEDYKNKPLICMQRIYIKKAMKKHKGHKTKAAKDLGITPRTLSTYIIQHSV